MSTDSVEERVSRLELPFNARGVDPFGVSKTHLTWAYKAVEPLYRRYFNVKVSGAQNIPARGRAILVGNHSGGVALDGLLTIAACFFELEPPRLAQGMAEKFINTFPFASTLTARTGQFTGTPETAERLLEEERLLMVFPEGAKGTAKLYKDRYSLVDFGTGFLRLALKTGAPIIPFGFVGGADAIPTVSNLYGLGKLVGVPYLPVTPWLLPVPKPALCELQFGTPLHFTGTGAEEDDVIARHVAEVKSRISSLVEKARETRRERIPLLPPRKEDAR